ncbi:MAG TPA: hypothetical protein EYO90_00655 [Candidatus Latescibacteria bacterium]|nr:hypothetical protein [Candidatus Latescibacterota bacterium]
MKAARLRRDETRHDAQAHAGILDGGDLTGVGADEAGEELLAGDEGPVGQSPAGVALPLPGADEVVDRRSHAAGQGQMLAALR